MVIMLPDGVVQGSCTACVLCLDGTTLHVSNLGDSGFMVVRDGNAVITSKPQHLTYNHPYHLWMPKAGAGESPSQADVGLTT